MWFFAKNHMVKARIYGYDRRSWRESSARPVFEFFLPSSKIFRIQNPMTQHNSPSLSKVAMRPLSPHIQVWKWSMNMTLSILHRASGIANSVGVIMLVWMLSSAAMGPECYDVFHHFISSIVGQIMLFGWTGSTIFHMLTGIRHLIMDSGKMITIAAAERAGIVIFILAVTLTLALWGCVKFFY